MSSPYTTRLHYVSTLSSWRLRSSCCTAPIMPDRRSGESYRQAGKSCSVFRVVSCEAVGAKCASGVGCVPDPCPPAAASCCCSCCPAAVPFMFLHVLFIFSFFIFHVFFHVFPSFIFHVFHFSAAHALSSCSLGFELHHPNLRISRLAGLIGISNFTAVPEHVVHLPPSESNETSLSNLLL